ncbi:MAG: lipoyl(octanoyl) transferase LipB [Verrucomicrobia bacterium]|nr:lipoyl(octanoyl) transferase LipB [Verrucomicrobiota bacterium]MDA1067729.1 lipoyl(octanoyl) transferase LipB [Verrucomicrobiota bacterium]
MQQSEQAQQLFPFQVEDWGNTEYEAAFEKQKAYVRDRVDGKREDTLIYTEHLPVFTMGLRRGAETHLIWDEAALSEKGISVYKSNRGGDITYHGPGQLTCYPVIHLEKLRDLHAYLRIMEDMLIQIVSHFGLIADRREGKTGIWIEERKIAAIGVAVKSWVTYHGFALNVNNDLDPFSGIVPCGIVDGTVTSLKKELGFPVDMNDVKAVVSQVFLDNFKNYLT